MPDADGEKRAEDNITVRLTRGSWQIEITCRQDKVQQAVESVLAGLASKEPILMAEEPKEVEEAKGHFETCRGLLQTMWREGWFGTAKQLSEVHDEMSRRGYHYDRTAVAHALVDLVREGTLFREGSMRNYSYVQRYPLKDPDGGAPSA